MNDLTPDATPQIPLHELVQRMSDCDVGRVDIALEGPQLAELIKTKIDQIAFVFDRFDAGELFLKEKAAQISQMRERIRTNKERLKLYVISVMQAEGFTRLPGNETYCNLQKAKPSVETTREPDEHDYLANPDLVRAKVTYEWNKEALSAAIASGSTFAFASLKETPYVRFYPNTPGAKSKKELKAKEAAT